MEGCSLGVKWKKHVAGGVLCNFAQAVNGYELRATHG